MLEKRLKVMSSKKTNKKKLDPIETTKKIMIVESHTEMKEEISCRKRMILFTMISN